MPHRGVVPSAGAAGLRVASRTDRGVSALGNALTLTSSLPASALLRALNGIAPDLFFTAATEVDETFPTRKPRRRWYRYFESPQPTMAAAVAAWKTAADCFQGVVDVRSLGRRWPARDPAVRAVEAIEAIPDPPFLLIDVRAPSFVWGMVRRMVAAGRALAVGQLTAARLRRALAGAERLTLPLAEPEPLVLWDVEYDVEWTTRAGPPTRQQERWRTQGVRTATLRARWLSEIRRSFP
ncbi:MAG TPA: hypothetical protein VFF67_00600 [Thermoplasmata archaeon]|nr:hypothetical protein [Thermoplasmata archaeon]